MPPINGPNKWPSPNAISMKPIFYSRSAESIEVTMAMEAAELAPPPIPPMIYAPTLTIKNVSTSLM